MAISRAMISFATCSANNIGWSALRGHGFAVCGSAGGEDGSGESGRGSGGEN